MWTKRIENCECLRRPKLENASKFFKPGSKWKCPKCEQEWTLDRSELRGPYWFIQEKTLMETLVELARKKADLQAEAEQDRANKRTEAKLKRDELADEAVETYCASKTYCSYKEEEDCE